MEESAKTDKLVNHIKLFDINQQKYTASCANIIRKSRDINSLETFTFHMKRAWNAIKA